MDCSTDVGNQGCNGGFIDESFDWVEKHGLCTQAAYPYTGNDDTCKTSCTPVAHIDGYVNVTINSDVALATALVQQPVQIVIEADQSAFQMYSSGVITGPCGTEVDHTALAVGYGTDGGVEYFKVT